MGLDDIDVNDPASEAVEVVADAAEAETTSIKLFRKWSYDDVSVDDISLEDYIAVKPKFAVYLPHTAQRYQSRRFRKASCPIVERLVAALMFAGRNAGKKLLAVNIVRHAFEIIHLVSIRTPSRFSSTPSLTPVHVKIPPASVPPVWYAVRPSTCPPSAGCARPFT